MKAAGVTQVCAGHRAGCEAAIRALRQVFAAVDAEAVLFVDVDNAFNRLNRSAALHSIPFICPPLGKILNNIYRVPPPACS